MRWLLTALFSAQVALVAQDCHHSQIDMERLAESRLRCRHLVSRQLPGAVHHDPAAIVQQALTLAAGQPLTAIDGSPLHLHAHTLCVHGDNASSVAAVQRIRSALNGQRA